MTTPKGINWNEQFYKLLRLSLGLTQEFPVEGVKGQYGNRSPLFFDILRPQNG